MYTPEPHAKKGKLSLFSVRISESTKDAIFRRAELRSQRENRPISPRQVARELLEYAVVLMDNDNNPSATDDLADEVMASALFARRALEIALRKHEGLADKLLRASRAEVRRRKHHQSNGDSI